MVWNHLGGASRETLGRGSDDGSNGQEGECVSMQPAQPPIVVHLRQPKRGLSTKTWALCHLIYHPAVYLQVQQMTLQLPLCHRRWCRKKNCPNMEGHLKNMVFHYLHQQVLCITETFWHCHWSCGIDSNVPSLHFCQNEDPWMQYVNGCDCNIGYLMRHILLFSTSIG